MKKGKKNRKSSCVQKIRVFSLVCVCLWAYLEYFEVTIESDDSSRKLKKEYIKNDVNLKGALVYVDNILEQINVCLISIVVKSMA